MRGWLPYFRKARPGWLGITGFVLTMSLSSCGLYLRTYRYSGVLRGMTEEDIIQRFGTPAAVQNVGALQLWRYPERVRGFRKKTEYFLIWFQDGHVVQWGKSEEERLREPQNVGTV